MKYFSLKKIGSVLIFAVIILAAYFINVEVQSYYGRQALEKANLQNFTLADALKKAEAENKLVLVDVSAIWCPNCRRLDNEVFANQEVRKFVNEKFVFSRLEYESPEGTDFLEKHNATGFPNLWLLDGKGNVVKKLRITFDPTEFLKQLN
ncbi:MAG: thioredoxin family protein [Pyrinomonadaceae bacterium]|nr:thioredoxin family protein [Pyrinomonadaceae bacterium]